MSDTPKDDAPPTGGEVRAMTAATESLDAAMARQDDAPPTGAEIRAARDATLALEGAMVERFVSRREFDRNRRNVRFALGGALGALVALVAVVVVLALSFYKLGDVVESNKDVIDAVNECITPTPPEDLEADPHECYDRGQSQTATALEVLIEGFNEGVDRIIDRLDELDSETP